MTRVQIEVRAEQPDTRTGAVVLSRLVEPMPRAIQIALRAQLLGQFAMEMRQRGAAFAIAAAHDLDRDLDRTAPVAFALIDLEQVLERDAIGRAAAIDQFAQQLFRTIEQPGSEVVARQLEFGERPVLGRQMRAIEQVLMDADGLVELAASAHDRTERQMRIDSGLAGRQRVDESIDREIGSVVEQVVDALIVVTTQVADAAHSAPCAFAASQHESETNRDDQNDVEVEVFEHQTPATSLFARASSV